MGMLLFVLVFLTIYGLMHALVFWGMHPLLASHPVLPSLVWCWMGLMIGSPLLVRFLDRSGHVAAARGLAWVSYCWMGLLFIAFCLFAAMAGWHLLALLIKHLLPGLPLLTLHRPAGSALVLLVTLCTGLYGVYEATDLRIEKIQLNSEKLPFGRERLRIAQISDLHLGLLHREETLAPVLAELHRLQPDLLVATGDIVDAQIDHLAPLSELWHRIDPPLGKYAVTGNHEYYAGLDQSLDFLKRSGFTVLGNEGITVKQTITLVGVNDPTDRQKTQEARLLEQNSRGYFTVLLKHRPLIDKKAAGLFDLQLSGHAHRGQIFPFNLLTALKYPRQNGLYPLPEGGWLYTSRGTGSWGPPMRILTPPEITLFEIVKQKKTGNKR
jgi:predicted MPP superfamily phosphohydrolase